MSTTPSSTPIALVTGGSRGLGKNTALHIARNGSDVILTYRSQAAEAQAVVAEITALGRRAVALHADDWSCWWRLAELEAKYRDGDRVREALSRAVALNPDLSRRADAVWREFVLATPAK